MQQGITAKRPLRVGLIATSVEFGGIERVLLNILHADSRIEFVPLVFTRTDIQETSLFEHLRALGTTYERIYVDLIQPSVLNPILNPPVNLAQLVGLVRKHRLDLIHSHGYRADVFALALSSLCALPVVSTVHGLIDNDRRLRVYNALDRRALRFFTRVIAVSSSIRDELIAHGVGSDKIHVIENVVGAAATVERGAARNEVRTAIGLSDREFVFGYLGRLSREKGVHYLIEAAAGLGCRHPDVRLLIVGDGPERAALELAASTNGIRDKVTFAGFQSDTSRWFAAMDAFVLPSLSEGTPMALLESMAAGVPAISTRVGGVPAVICDNETGLLIEPANVRGLQNAMNSLASDRVLARRLAANARESVRRQQDVQSWMERIIAVYRAAVVNRREPSTAVERAQAK